MTIYLTEKTNKDELKKLIKMDSFCSKTISCWSYNKLRFRCKRYKKIMPILETMAEIGMPLLIHGEVTDKEIDIFDREKVFIDQKLDFICKELPELKNNS